MRSLLLLAALVGLGASQWETEDNDFHTTSSKDSSDTDPKFYTRMSFYTPEDGKASVIVDTPAALQQGDGRTMLNPMKGEPSFLVTTEQVDDVVVPWMPFSIHEKNAFEASFSLDNFPAREEPYTLQLWGVSNDRQTFLTTTTLLRVLPEEEAQNLARQDRFEGDVYVQSISPEESQPEKEQPEEQPEEEKPEQQKPAKEQPKQQKVEEQKPEQKPEQKKPEEEKPEQKKPEEEKSEQKKPEEKKKKPEHKHSQHKKPDPDLPGGNATPKPEPLVMEGKADHEGSLPMGWWRKVMPATVHETTWNHVQKSWRTGNLTNFVEELKLGGTNVIHPTNGSGPSTVPFEADLRFHLTKAANGHEVFVLFDVDFRSPGGDFKKYYTETHDPNLREPGESKEEGGKPFGEGRRAAVRRSLLDIGDDPEDVTELMDALKGKTPGEVLGYIMNILLGLLKNADGGCDCKGHSKNATKRTGPKHIARQVFPTESHTDPTWFPHDGADAQPSTASNISSEGQTKPLPSTPKKGTPNKAHGTHAISPTMKERIAWEAADTLRHILNDCFASGDIHEQPDSIKAKAAMEGIKTLRHVIDAYFDPQGEDSAPLRRDAPPSGFAQDIANIVEAFKSSVDTNSSSSATEQLPRCGAWLRKQARDGPDDADNQWPCRLAPHEKADIVVRFKRNLNDVLAGRIAERRHGVEQDVKQAGPHFEEETDGWEHHVMQLVHRDVMTAFEHKVKASVDQWFQIPKPPVDATGPKAKRQNGQSIMYDAATDDSDAWEHRILDDMHKDVLEAFETRVKDDLWKQNNHRRDLPRASAEKQERVIRTRNLKKVLEDFDACARDPACDVDSEDFVEMV